MVNTEWKAKTTRSKEIGLTQLELSDTTSRRVVETTRNRSRWRPRVRDPTLCMYTNTAWLIDVYVIHNKELTTGHSFIVVIIYFCYNITDSYKIIKTN